MEVRMIADRQVEVSAIFLQVPSSCRICLQREDAEQCQCNGFTGHCIRVRLPLLSVSCRHWCLKGGLHAHKASGMLIGEGWRYSITSTIGLTPEC